MDRDDLLLRAIAEGATSSAALAVRTSLSPASVWRGLRRLVAAEYVFSPARGVYRLTASGERVLEPTGAPERETQDTDPRAPEPTERPASRAGTEDRPALRAWLVGGALVALGVGVFALRARVARTAAPAPPAASPPSPAAWPYNGQTWGW
jgi:hypothetical protein